jgi:hypothetical protein
LKWNLGNLWAVEIDGTGSFCELLFIHVSSDI